ncbi:hypothetical protein ABZ923_37305 [Streptomyces sp. NPDC046881]|uniref:hypothetical protein n=1 Tax=Streptomyces sp. NPDC046881 TaxID=3155374 RepID=UPI0033F062D7
MTAGLCPGCGHAVEAHPVEARQRVCTRGYGRVACRECAHGLASLVAERYGSNVAECFAAELRRGQGLRLPRGYALARPVVAGWSASGGMFGSSTA